MMGSDMAEGRAFRDTDGPDAPRVAIVNATLAKRYYADRNPVGAHLQLRRQRRQAARDRRRRRRHADRRVEPARGARSLPAVLAIGRVLEAPRRARRRRSHRRSPRSCARELRAIDPTSAVERMTTMAEIRRESVAPRTFAMRLLIGFAVVATLLALVGLYGVLSLSVNSRTKEIAVRKAVGAQRHQIVQLIVGEGSRLVAGGLLLGADRGGAGRPAAADTALRRQAIGSDGAWRPRRSSSAAVALAACLVPAYRASRVDLMESLRQE